MAPSLVRVVSSSADEYLSSFRHLRLRGFILERATRPWKVTGCRLPACVVEHGVGAAPWVASGSTADGVVTFAFSASRDAGLLFGGREVPEGDLALWPGGSLVSIVARRPGDLFVVSVEEVELARLAARDGERKTGPVAGVHRVRPEDLDHLRVLASRLLEVVEDAGPADLVPEEARLLDRALVDELARLAAGFDSCRRKGAARGARASVLERIEELLDAHPSAPVYVADLCAATGLPERTLRYVLVERYGKSPIRLLRSRRLCQLRRALQAEDAARESLARLAERHGFRHMGSLAADYWNLFGELPSETRRAAVGYVRAAPRPRATVPADEGLRRPADQDVAMLAGAAAR